MFIDPSDFPVVRMDFDRPNSEGHDAFDIYESLLAREQLCRPVLAAIFVEPSRAKRPARKARAGVGRKSWGYPLTVASDRAALAMAERLLAGSSAADPDNHEVTA